MKRLISAAAFAVVLCHIPALGQVNSMLPDPDAKAMAMGGVTMTALSTSHALYGNASSVIFSPTPINISSSFYHTGKHHRDGVLTGGSDFYSVSGQYNIDGHNAVQAGWRQVRNHGEKALAVDANYSRRLTSRWSLGLTARYFRNSAGERTSEALAADLSTTYLLPLSLGERSSLRAGARLANLGAWIGGGSNDALPINFTVGAAFDTYLTDAHQITVGIDCAYYARSGYVRGGQASIGAEYNLMQLFQLRAGYHAGDNSFHNPNYGSVGCGLRFMHLRLDFAYLLSKKSSPLHDTYSISFGLDF